MKEYELITKRPFDALTSEEQRLLAKLINGMVVDTKFIDGVRQPVQRPMTREEVEVILDYFAGTAPKWTQKPFDEAKTLKEWIGTYE